MIFNLYFLLPQIPLKNTTHPFFYLINCLLLWTACSYLTYSIYTRNILIKLAAPGPGRAHVHLLLFYLIMLLGNIIVALRPDTFMLLLLRAIILFTSTCFEVSFPYRRKKHNYSRFQSPPNLPLPPQKIEFDPKK